MPHARILSPTPLHTPPLCRAINGGINHGRKTDGQALIWVSQEGTSTLEFDEPLRHRSAAHARRLALGVNEAITLGSVITPYRKPDRNADLRPAEIQGRKTPI